MRSLSLQQEFLLTMMRVRTGILLQDLPFLFQISLGLVSNKFPWAWLAMYILTSFPQKTNLRKKLSFLVILMLT